MDSNQAREVQDYLQWDMGLDVSVREGYSGRGMYGAEVPALVIEWGDEVAVGMAFEALGFDHQDVPNRLDSMGLRAILY